MKEIILTVGPQGSGKSTFCEKVAVSDPDLVVISRDAILTELFGTAFLDAYTGGHFHAEEVMWRRVRNEIKTSSKSRMILDCWNGFPSERRKIVTHLWNCGVKRIVAWYFVTPIEAVSEWFWKKPGVARMSQMRELHGQGFTFFGEDAPARNYTLYHESASGIDSEPFNEVVRINAMITKPEDVVLSWTGLKS